MKPLLLMLILAGTALSASPADGETAELKATLDVKDADVREVLRSLQKQCAVRNLVIDPDVTGQGTFYFRDVPCDLAFRTVFRTTGLVGRIEPNSVVTVSRRR